MDFYYHGAWRMDWGLGNPNKTGALIACLLIAVWALPLLWKKGFWPALFLCTLLAGCLVQTYSRGGMTAAAMGILVLILSVPRPWPKMRGLGVVVSLGLVVSVVILTRAHTRYMQGLFADDLSIHNRLFIWKQVPSMMAAAPWGWGEGKAGDAYNQWFQPLDQSTSYLNLINSHFNFMVEWGWLGSVLYLFAWIAIILLCWPPTGSRLKAIPLAVWLTFGIAACFSHVEESPWLWLLPAGALIFTAVERYRAHRWPAASAFLVSGACSVCLVAVLVLFGNSQMTLPIGLSEGAVLIGRPPASTVVLVDRNVVGSLYGHAIRRYLASDALSKSSYCFVESTNAPPPPSPLCLVITGRFAGEPQFARKCLPTRQIIYVNPTCSRHEAALSLFPSEDTRVFFGEYCETPSLSSWSNVPGLHLFRINGAGEFIPSWPGAIWIPSSI